MINIVLGLIIGFTVVVVWWAVWYFLIVPQKKKSMQDEARKEAEVIKQKKMLEMFGREYVEDYYKDMMIYENDEEIEDQIAYLEDVRFDEKDLGRTKNVKKKFIRQKLDEQRWFDDYD